MKTYGLQQFLVAVNLLLVLGCVQRNKPSYTQLDDGLYYQLRTIGSDEKVIDGNEYISGFISIFNAEGNLIFQPKHEVTFQLKYDQGFDFALRRFGLQDSISIIWEKNQNSTLKSGLDVFFDLGLPQSTQIDLRITAVRNTVAYQLDSLSFFNDPLNEERRLLSNYIESTGIDSSHFFQGIFMKKLIEYPDHKPLKKGNSIRVEYIGRYLDGRVFDATSNWKDEFVIEYGRPMQLIEGLDLALSQMKEGEVAKIILPSQLAFGKLGSPSANVPPYTAVTYELKLVEIF